MRPFLCRLVSHKFGGSSRLHIEFFQADDAAVSFQNRAMHYADGLFETLRVSGGIIPLWGLHRERLLRGARVLKFDFDQAAVATLKRRIDDELNAFTGVLKILVLRDWSGRGYATQTDTVQVWISTHPLPNIVASISIGLSAVKLARQPILAGVKHLARIENTLASRQLRSGDFDDLLMLDTTGCVIETTKANVFFKLNQHWITPPLEHSGVAGVMREYLLGQWAHYFPGPVSIKELRADDLPSVSHGFSCNAVTGLTPINTLLGRELSEDSTLSSIQLAIAKMLSSND